MITQHVADLGGDVSQAQVSLVRRAAALTVELERWETRFAADDCALPEQLDSYQRCLNSLRRTLETLGLDRKAKPLNGEYRTNDPTRAIVEAIRERHRVGT